MKKRILVIGDINKDTKSFIDKLIHEGHEVIVASKDQYKDHMTIDFNAIKTITSFVKAFNQKYAYLDVLIVMSSYHSNEKHLSEDGFDKMMAINFIGPLLLTEGLKVALQTEEHARIIYINSDLSFKGIVSDLTQASKGASGYANSKLALLKYGLYLSDQLKEDHVTINMVHESIETRSKLRKLLKPKKGGYSYKMLYDLALSDDVRYKTGKLYKDNAVLALPQNKLNKTEIQTYIKGIFKLLKLE